MKLNHKIRFFIGKMLTPIVRFIGKLQPPFSVKRAICSWYDWINLIQPLDVILANTYGHTSNIFNPSNFKHAILYVGIENNIPMVIEALGVGVIKRPLIECISEKDEIAIIRSNEIHLFDISIGLDFANDKVGKPYDFLFDEVTENKFESFYCSELCWWAWKESYKDTNFIKKELFLGVVTTTPDDFYNAAEKGKTKIIYDSREHVNVQL